MPLYEYTCRKCEHSFEALVTGAHRDRGKMPEVRKHGTGSTHRAAGTRARGRRPTGDELSRRRSAVRRTLVWTKG